MCSLSTMLIPSKRRTQMTNILYETLLGYITLEKTGKSKSYVVWIHTGTAAIRRHTIGEKIPNAFERAKDKLSSAFSL